jgi:DNA helicase-2/ATP-dependent DNA helicase PcrA
VHQQPGGADRHVYGSRTRFIPQSTLDAFQQRSWTKDRHQAYTAKAPMGIVDIASKMREMWR